MRVYINQMLKVHTPEQGGWLAGYRRSGDNYFF